MNIAIGIALIISCIIIHELGHAVVMRKYGIGIARISIGINCPIKLSFSRQWLFGRAIIQITPLLIMAYVEPTEEGAATMRKLPYYATADITGAGPLANLVYALVIGLVVLMASPSTKSWEAIALSVLVLVATIALLVLARRIIVRYIFPLLGMGVLGLVAFSLLTDPWKTVAGPGTLVSILSKQPDVSSVAMFAAFASLSLGLMNLIPLGGLDGGKQFESLIRLVWPSLKIGRYQTLTLIFMFALIVLSIMSDIRGCTG